MDLGNPVSPPGVPACGQASPYVGQTSCWIPGSLAAKAGGLIKLAPLASMHLLSGIQASGVRGTYAGLWESVLPGVFHQSTPQPTVEGKSEEFWGDWLQGTRLPNSFFPVLNLLPQV